MAKKPVAKKTKPKEFKYKLAIEARVFISKTLRERGSIEQLIDYLMKQGYSRCDIEQQIRISRISNFFSSNAMRTGSIFG